MHIEREREREVQSIEEYMGMWDCMGYVVYAFAWACMSARAARANRIKCYSMT